MKNKKLAYFTFTYCIFGIYLVFAILSYNKILNSINIKMLFSDELCEWLAIKYFIIFSVGNGLNALLRKRHTWEFPIMVGANLINIYGVAGITSVIGALLKFAGIYDSFIKQIAIIVFMVFITCLIYGISTYHDSEDSKITSILGVICLVLILLMNIVNVKYRIIHIIVDALLLVWFSNGIVTDSQKITTDYDKIDNKVKLWLTALQNATFLCDDLMFVFGQTMKMTADESV